MNFAFFGTSEFSVIILDQLKRAGHLPHLIVTTPDAPQGRHLIMTPPPAKVWAATNSIPYLQPASLKDLAFINKLQATSYKLFIVASYGKIIPQSILDIPEHGTLNVHPSLLPKLRGPSPIVGAILTEDKTGVSIMQLDAEMDHGPIVAQKDIAVTDWPPYAKDLEHILAEAGGELLAHIMTGYLDGSIAPREQDHTAATYTKKFTKKDMEVDMSEDTHSNLRKIRAFAPHAFTFVEHNGKTMRLIIKRAKIENDKLVLERVVPEGRKEMSFQDLEHGFLND